MNETLPDDVERLKLLVSDLTRRLQNAQHTIDAERAIAVNCNSQTEHYKAKLGEVTNKLRYEAAKNLNLERKNLKELESSRFETNKKRAAKLHDDLRLVQLDHMITNFKKEPLKLTKLRSKVESIEQEQNSQKVMLQQLVELEKMNEELSIAAQHGDLDECNILLRSGASVNHVDSAGYLPIHYACANGFYNVVKLFLEFGCDCSSYITGHSPVIIAATSGHSHIIKLLVDFGGDVEDTGLGGCPAISVAFSNGRVDCMEYLLTMLGANINSYDANEDTLLHTAVKSTSAHAVDVIQFLLHRGIDTEKINKQNLTALQLALYNKNKPAVDILAGKSTAMSMSIGVDNEALGSYHPVPLVPSTHRQSGISSRLSSTSKAKVLPAMRNSFSAGVHPPQQTIHVADRSAPPLGLVASQESSWNNSLLLDTSTVGRGNGQGHSETNSMDDSARKHQQPVDSGPANDAISVASSITNY